jgi:SAM-dependent methyltransferase
MTAVKFEYVDSALKHIADGEALPFWRHFHWGLFPDPEVEDPSPERYLRAAAAMTEHIVAAAGVEDRTRVLDVGCGFGGTLDYLRGRNPGSTLAGINIDFRQIRTARELLGLTGDPATHPMAFVTADGCQLPVASGSLDHILAVECIFHFTSRRNFLREAARVLKPGGTVALSDFLMRPGQLGPIVARMAQEGLGDGNWYGHMGRPLTSAKYARLAEQTGLEVLVDDDVTAQTIPTYAALRLLSSVSETPGGVTTTGALEELSVGGSLQYHVLAFRRSE